MPNPSKDFNKNSISRYL